MPRLKTGETAVNVVYGHKKSNSLSSARIKLSAHTASDSDASGETNSLSAESTAENVPEKVNQRKKNRRRGSEWEILEGLKDGQRFEKKPDVFSGFLHKKRKWPLKGWHKRYFVLDKGILTYGKNPVDVGRGKIHGRIDIGLSVISSKEIRWRLDIDAEEFIYHLKAKLAENFNSWIQQLTEHRLYRQHILSYGKRDGALRRDRSGDCGEPNTPKLMGIEESLIEEFKTIKLPAGRISDWLSNVGPHLEQVQHDILSIQKNIAQLASLLDRMEPRTRPLILGVRNSESNLYCSLPPPQANLNLSSSSINVGEGGAGFGSDSQSLSGSIQLTDNSGSKSSDTSDKQANEDFIVIAREVYNGLKSAIVLICSEKDKLQQALNQEPNAVVNSEINSNPTLVVGLKTSLNQTLQQNAELRRRLKSVREATDISDLPLVEYEVSRHSNRSLSYSSSCVSEFFDAEELPDDKRIRESSELRANNLTTEIHARDTDSSSEAGSISSEDSASSESALGNEDGRSISRGTLEGNRSQSATGRRSVLPAPRPSTEGLSLWNLLSKNIGRDLSQVSMPVALNEPLNMLQRLCEELEYSDLLDKAAELDDPYERMVYVAAFAVSAYASSYSRAGNKPFNPLLGETYECIREDKGFQFLAEQVSHHPPISACYAESPNFIFWQEIRIKTRFWGKSMEFQPIGKVHVMLPRTGEIFTWNKVTTCVHNLFSGQRWVDQYGELHLTNERINCKLTFVKASYWSSKRHEIVGTVTNEAGKPVRQLFGKWSEALYCGVAPSARCIWRAGTMPPNHERYYGFTRFAMEMNELGNDSHLLPPTDSRFRPDQRALEEGNLNAAEQYKLTLENAQRDRRKHREQTGMHYEPLWFSRRNDNTEEEWKYNGKYWDTRKNGFQQLSFETLW